MSLKDYRPDETQFDVDEEDVKETDTPIPSSGFHEEINTLKIDKLSNRVTIISIILPCVIGAILVFAYLDMKERVVDVDQTKDTQFQRISQQLEEKINTIDVKIAKNRFDLDKALPDLEAKQKTFDGMLAKLAASKADNTGLSKLEKKVAANSGQDKKTLDKVNAQNNQITSKIKTHREQIEKIFSENRQEIALFKEEFDARLLELSDYEQQVGELRKDASLLDKKFKRLEQETITQKELENLISVINVRLDRLETKMSVMDQKLDANLSRMQKEIDLFIKSSQTQDLKPQLNIDAKPGGSISQKPLPQ